MNALWVVPAESDQAPHLPEPVSSARCFVRLNKVIKRRPRRVDRGRGTYIHTVGDPGYLEAGTVPEGGRPTQQKNGISRTHRISCISCTSCIACTA